MKKLALILMVAGLPTLATAQHYAYTLIEPVQRDTTEDGFGMIDISGYGLTPRRIDVRQIDVHGRTVGEATPMSMRINRNDPQRAFDANRFYRLAELPLFEDEILAVAINGGGFRQVLREPFDFTLERGQTIYFRIIKLATPVIGH